MPSVLTLSLRQASKALIVKGSPTSTMLCASTRVAPRPHRVGVRGEAVGRSFQTKRQARQPRAQPPRYQRKSDRMNHRQTLASFQFDGLSLTTVFLLIRPAAEL